MVLTKWKAKMPYVDVMVGTFDKRTWNGCDKAVKRMVGPDGKLTSEGRMLRNLCDKVLVAEKLNKENEPRLDDDEYMKAMKVMHAEVAEFPESVRKAGLWRRVKALSAEANWVVLCQITNAFSGQHEFDYRNA